MDEKDLIVAYNLLHNKVRELITQRDMAIQALIHVFQALDGQGDSIQSVRAQLEPSLPLFNIEMNTHVGWAANNLAQGPAEAYDQLNEAFMQAAREYYRALDEGEDPGPAETIVKRLSNVLSTNPLLVARLVENKDFTLALLNLERYKRGFRDE